MSNFVLKFKSGHLFVTIAGNDWLLDTGASASFGKVDSIQIEKQTFSIPTGYMGLDAEKLSEFVHNSTAGIIGADILANFDILFDLQSEIVTFSEEELLLDGDVLSLSNFMGIPIIMSTIGDEDHQMIFDTGAQVSYFQGSGLNEFPSTGVMDDFYPGIGEFQTETFLVNVRIGSKKFNLRTGSLDGLLGMTVNMTGTMGIIGNEILSDSIVGYFPRRDEFVIK